MKAKVIKTGEMVDVYHEPQHGQITNIYKESVLVNGRMWTEDELDFCVKTSEAPEKISDFEMALTEMIANAQKCVVEPIVVAQQWKDYLVELAKSEEPVSEELEKIVEEITEPTVLNAYGTKELARRLRNTICGTSVSKDLEEVAKIYTLDDSIKPWRNLTKEAFIAGAKWQKKQFEKDYTNLCNGIATAKGLAVAMAYDKGMADAREQMIEWLRNHIRNYAFMVTDEFEGDIDVDTAINDLKQAMNDGR